MGKDLRVRVRVRARVRVRGGLGLLGFKVGLWLELG